jgi:alpha-L-rhamnosidase
VTYSEPITLNSSLVDVIENQSAYQAIVGALDSVDSTISEAWRKNTKWTSRRTLQESFRAVPRPAVEAALEALGRN